MIKLAADDGRQAVRLVRERAGEFGYRPDRVGMIGFSAGGMVTSEALFGPAETRPDFAAIIYGAREIKEVPSPAPPLFLAVAADDAMSVGRTVDLFTAYRKGKGLAELHVFQTGARTASSTKGAAPTTSWTAWRSGSRPTSCCRGREAEPRPRLPCQAPKKRPSPPRDTRSSTSSQARCRTTTSLIDNINDLAVAVGDLGLENLQNHAFEAGHHHHAGVRLQGPGQLDDLLGAPGQSSLRPRPA